MAGAGLAGEPAPPREAEMAEPEVVPAQRLDGRLAGVFATPTPDAFTTAPVGVLDLRLDGIAGDRHHGFTRRSGSREPWYARGTEMRSRRQLSVVSVEELAAVAGAMDLPEIRPEWIGANLVVAGIPRVSFLPPGTRLHLAGGAVVLVEHMNGPCRHAGKGIGDNFPEREGLDLLFARAAQRRRGVVATVDRAGAARLGDAVEVHIPQHWLYRAWAAPPPG